MYRKENISKLKLRCKVLIEIYSVTTKGLGLNMAFFSWLALWYIYYILSTQIVRSLAVYVPV